MKFYKDLHTKVFLVIEIIATSLIGIALLLNLNILTNSFVIFFFYSLYVMVSFVVAYILFKKGLFQRKLIRIMYPILVALFIRLLVGYLFNLNQQGDYGIYLSVANKLAHGVKENMFYYGIFPHALHYPIFLAGIYKLIGIVTWLPELLNIIAGIATVAFASLLMDKWVSPRAGLATGLAIALNPSMILFILLAGGEPLVDGFILCGLYLLVIGIEKGQKLSVILLSFSGISISLGNFFRPTGVLLIAAIIIFQLFITSEPFFHRIKKTTPVLITYIITTMLFVLLTSQISGFEKPDYSYGWNLFIGSNGETNGGWNAIDGELFKQVSEELQDPSLIQKHFADLGVQRYLDMELGTLSHGVHKLEIWIDESYLASTVTSWQSEYTKFKTTDLFGIFDLICSYFNLFVLLGVMITMVVSLNAKKTPIFIKLSSLYIIGVMSLLILLEAAHRYKGAYYGTLTMLCVYGYWVIIQQFKDFHSRMNSNR